MIAKLPEIPSSEKLRLIRLSRSVDEFIWLTAYRKGFVKPRYPVPALQTQYVWHWEHDGARRGWFMCLVRYIRRRDAWTRRAWWSEISWKH